ncbi:MscS Mechanosensitive ion channel [Ignisphaera aggregans DSM 17230]|uniref:MscS Mechanosensitive ion channel n=1 Tax=Ignisphaera aggregans (strain DSM 17230 / JCM 13409 / AQ1.S1) TaxID=583356 RepID=E0STB0_IGNAA|nr:MscS Mechanosensitive ion channel [Ignisphaera aggregans DSM 17230]
MWNMGFTIPLPSIEMENILRILEIVSIVCIGIVFAYLLRKALFRTLIRVLPQSLAHNIAKATFYTVAAITILIALGTMGIDLTALVVAGGFAGIVVGFALQPILSNLFAGIYIMSEKALSPGELVEVNGVQGYVLEVSVMSTKIRSLDGAILRIPNNEILNTVLRNFSRTPIRRIEFVVSIAYRENAERVYTIINNVLDNHPFILLDPPPEVFVSNLGSSGVDITVRVWVPSELWYDVARDLLWKLKKAISEAGIEIPFTQIDIWFRTPLKLEAPCKS